jgi:hypothetical protein
VTLEITARDGTLVRRYSSADVATAYDPQALNVPMHWARPIRTLPATRGAHRFVWDLRYAPPGAVSREFPIAAIEGDTPLEPLGVLALPGGYTVTLTVDGRKLARPLTLKMDPRATITPVGLRQQFDLGTRLARMMSASYAQNRVKSSDDLVGLNSDLATAYDVVEGADRAPTAQAFRAVDKLQQRFRKLVP